MADPKKPTKPSAQPAQPSGFNWKKWVIIGIIAIVIIGIIGWIIGSYNTLISLDQGTQSQWSKVNAAYQKRYDLIPNLVNVVKGYTQYESSILENITALRTQWMNAQTVDEKMQTSNQLEGALKTIFATSESYPNLKADTQFTGLQDELASTENEIKVERMKYADAVMAYNGAVLRFPSNVIANWFGFREKTYYAA